VSEVSSYLLFTSELEEEPIIDLALERDLSSDEMEVDGNHVVASAQPPTVGPPPQEAGQRDPGGFVPVAPVILGDGHGETIRSAGLEWSTSR
jgi:hypothetical protein